MKIDFHYISGRKVPLTADNPQKFHCGSDALDLSCPDDKRIRIDFASYGTNVRITLCHISQTLFTHLKSV